MAPTTAGLSLLSASAAMLLLAGCSTVPPTEDPVYLKLTDLEARLMRVERVLNNQSLIELATSVDELRADMRTLRGELETLQFETQNAAERQRQLYLDIDQRLQTIEQTQARGPLAVAPEAGGATSPAFGSNPTTPASSGFATTLPNTGAAGNDQEAYQAAFDLLRNARYEESAQAFGSFLTNFPNSPLADNAQYWLAETLYVRRNFEGALPEFQKVIDEFPESAKMPDALLKVGFCNYELRRWDAARAALEQVTRQFPDTTAARLAAQRLERLAQDGG